MNGLWPKQFQLQLLELSKVGDCDAGVDMNIRNLSEVMGLKRSAGRSYSHESPQAALKDLTVPVLIWRALARRRGST